MIPDRLRPAAAPVPAPVASSAKPVAPVKPQSLIERYNLSAKLDGPASVEEAGKWEASRENRERDLRARKEKMILEARRKLLEKQKAAQGPAAAKVE